MRQEQATEDVVRTSAAFIGLLDGLSDPVLASNETGRILYVNAAAVRLLGWSADALAGRPLTTIMPERLRAAHEAGFRRFVTSGMSTIIGRPIRVPALHRDGSEIEVDLTLSDLSNQTGRTFVVAILRDMRDRVELERKVATQSKVLAQYAAMTVLADATTVGDAMPKLLEATARALQWDVGNYWTLDVDSKRLVLSAAWSSRSEGADRFVAACRHVTFGEGEGLIGRAFASGEAVWSKGIRSDSHHVRAPVVSEHGFRSELAFPVASANRKWGVLEYLSRREEDLDEELRQTVSVLGSQVGQFLQRLENEEDLRRAWAQADAERRNLRELFEHAPAAIAIVRGAEMRYELSNAVNQQLAGSRQLVGRTVREALPELDADGVTAVVRRVYETGEPFIASEYPVTMPGTADRPARRIFMNGIYQPLRGSTGATEGVMIFSYDVTDLVESRERVRDAEERLRLAVESASVGTWDYEPTTGVVRADARYRRLFGLGPAGEVTTGALLAAIHPDDRERVTEAVQRSFDPKSHGDYAVEYRTRGIEDGLERWISVRGRSFFGTDGRPIRFVGTGVDITDERRALDRLRLLSEASTILSSSLDYRTTLAKVAQLAVPHLADWCIVDIAKDGTETEQVVVAHVDPAKVDLARDLRRLYPPDPRYPSGVTQVLTTGKPMLVPVVTDDMFVRSARDEENLRILRALGMRSALLVPLTTRERAIAVLGLFHAESGRRYTEQDVSFVEEIARRAAVAIENARLYDEARRAIGIRDQFLSIASHELRTPLTSLTLQLSSLSRAATTGMLSALPTNKIESRVQRMEQQAARLTSLVDELLDVSRISTGSLALNPEQVDLVEVTREVLERLSDEAERAKAPLRFNAPGSLVGVWDRSRLDQVLTNIIGNAIKYAPGQPVDIEMTLHGEMASVTVRDRGPGVDVTDQERIFRQFERAAPPSLAGLGLGLWLASRIVQAHGGRIDIASQRGEGASFTVQLPRRPPT